MIRVGEFECLFVEAESFSIGMMLDTILLFIVCVRYEEFYAG